MKRNGSKIVEKKGGSQILSSSSSGTGSAASASSSGAPRVDLALLQEENNALIHRITDLQQHKWRLEERIKDLETLNRTLCEDVASKAAVIRDYVMTVKSSGRRDEVHRQGEKLKSIFRLKVILS